MASNRVPPAGATSATTSSAGIVQLTDSTSSTSTTTAATPNAVKSAYDLANGAIAKTLTTTTGDIIYASGANTPARLGIGSTGQVLKVSGGIPSWGTDDSGYAWTQVASGNLSGSSVNISNLSSDEYYIELSNWSISADGLGFAMTVNGTTSYNYTVQGDVNSTTYLTFGGYVGASQTFHGSSALIQLAKTNSARKPMISLGSGQQTTYVMGGFYAQTNTITSIQLLPGTGTWDAGTYKIWGRG